MAYIFERKDGNYYLNEKGLAKMADKLATDLQGKLIGENGALYGDNQTKDRNDYKKFHE